MMIIDGPIQFNSLQKINSLIVPGEATSQRF